MHLNKQNMSQIKGIVFDLDDTLYPQESFKRSGFAVVADWVSDHYGCSRSMVMSELEMIMQIKGPSYSYMFDDLSQRLAIDERSVPKMVNVFITHEPKISCYPGVITMLNRLRKHFKLGILTDGSLEVQQRKIRALGLDTEVDEILCSDMMGLEKPAIELLQWFESKFNLTGTEMMYVGDNPKKDFYGANLRNWTTVCVMTGQYQDIDCESTYQSSLDTPSIINLEKLLKSNNPRGCRTKKP